MDNLLFPFVASESGKLPIEASNASRSRANARLKVGTQVALYGMTMYKLCAANVYRYMQRVSLSLCFECFLCGVGLKGKHYRTTDAIFIGRVP